MPDRPTRTLATGQSTAGAPTGDSTGLAPDPPASPAVAPDPPPGYEFVGEIGHGGMGVVYQARDLSLDRDVAVKLLQDRYPVGSFAACRFLDEARITGQLQHPGIPAVHQVGALPNGRPFLAMKLIKGRTLDELLNERADPSADRGRFLAVFEQVCQAVGYAHAHHVIHRDLKPANVMVGAFGEVQVMDWGLAKVLTSRGVHPPGDDPDETTLGTEIRSTRGEDAATQAGSLLGTPAYMAPEQAIGAVDRLDERTDVFGLGGVLCAVLTGRPPYVGDTAESTRQLAARAKLDDAHARLDACGAEPELVALCKRCLSSEPSDRPRHAGEVADAVHQLRTDAEDRARRAELDRAKAEVQDAERRKRRRVQAALAAAVLAAGGLAAGGGWWLDRQATARETERRVEATRNREAAEIALGQAEQALRKDNPVYGEVDAALAQAEQRLIDGPDDLRGRLADLTKARRMLDRLDEIDARRWTVSVETGWIDEASARGAYPAAFRDHGLDPAADPPDVLADRVRRSPIAARLTAALDDWLAVGGPTALLDLAGRLDPDPDRSALRRALRAGDVTAIKALVAGLDGRALPPAFAAFVGGHRGVPDADAERLLRAAQAAHPAHFGVAIRTAKRTPRSRPDDVAAYCRIALAIRPTSALCFNHLGFALWLQRDLDGAVAAFREAVRLEPKDSLAHTNLGNALSSKGDLDEAVAACREAVRVDPKHALAHANLGVVLLKKGDVEGAGVASQEALRLDPELSAAHFSLAVVLLEKGDLDGGVAALRETVRLDPKHPLAHTNLGVALRAKGDLAGAVAAFRETVRLDPQHAMAHNNLGFALLQNKGDVNGAVAAYREALRLDPKLPQAHYNLGNVLRAKGDLAGAVAAFREAVRHSPKDHHTHLALADALRDKGDADGAIAASREAVRLAPGYYGTHWNLGNALWAKRDLDGAAASFRESIRLNPRYLGVHFNLGLVLNEKRDWDGAAASFREVIRLDPKNASAHTFLGDSLLARGDADGAVASFREAIRLDPKQHLAHRSLAAVLATGPDGVRNGRRAVEHATRACELTGWNDFAAIEALAAAYAEGGNFDKAVEYQKKAVAFPIHEKVLGKQGRERLDLYARKMPYRDPKLAPREVAPPPRPTHRKPSLNQFTADLAAWRKRLAADPAKNRGAVHRAMAHWLTDPDLASVRERAELEKLPLGERVGWVKLWTAVRELRDATAPPEAAPPPRPVTR